VRTFGSQPRQTSFARIEVYIFNERDCVSECNYRRFGEHLREYTMAQTFPQDLVGVTRYPCVAEDEKERKREREGKGERQLPTSSPNRIRYSNAVTKLSRAYIRVRTRGILHGFRF